MHSVLLVDDDAELLGLLDAEFRRAGFRTSAAGTGGDGLARARRTPPDLVVVDLELPDVAGGEILRELKGDDRTRAAAVIAVSASRDDVDRVVAFELGVDDFLGKPFSVREVVLRARAVLRYAGAHVTGQPTHEVGGVRVDGVAHRAFLGGRPLPLSPVEFRLLVALASHPGRTRSRENLLDEVWGPGRVGGSRTLDTHVKQLRRKLGAEAELVETVRNVGYRFRNPGPARSGPPET